MPPRETPAVRPPACKLLHFPALSNGNSLPLLTALSTTYLWYSLNTVLQSTAPYKRELRLSIAITISLP